MAAWAAVAPAGLGAVVNVVTTGTRLGPESKADLRPRGAGFTYIEVLVALSLTVVAVIPLAGAISQAIASSEKVHRISRATEVLQRAAEELKASKDFKSLTTIRPVPYPGETSPYLLERVVTSLGMDEQGQEDTVRRVTLRLYDASAVDVLAETTLTVYERGGY